jgi:hypothetical protein
MRILKALAAVHVVLIGTMLALVSCVSTQTKFPHSVTKEVPRMPAPLWATFLSIYQEKYVLHENDCSNKAAKYLRALDDAGYDAAMIVIKSRVAMIAAAQSENPEDAIIHHVVVRVAFEDTTIYYDPTNNSASTNLEYFGYYQFELTYEQLKATEDPHWVKEFKIND